MEQGVRVLNAFLLAEDEAAHAKRLLHLMRPPQGAVVLDAGCGVGELARLMRASARTCGSS
jgi:cyclopropane fatty-acyl-phospholipid synthase-like methyltransferase